MKIKAVECKSCKKKHPQRVMIGKKCYLCILAEWPPKTKRQYSIYVKAVSIRISLNSPLTMQQGLNIVNIVGLGNLGLMQEVIEGKIVPLLPAKTFYQRLVCKLGE